MGEVVRVIWVSLKDVGFFDVVVICSFKGMVFGVLKTECDYRVSFDFIHIYFTHQDARA